jgi:hypothetical protein
MDDAGLHRRLREDGADRLGKPSRPSPTAIRMSFTLRVFGSFITFSQNLGNRSLTAPVGSA